MQDGEDEVRTHQAQQSVPEVPSVWTPPAHKRDKSTSAPLFLRGHRRLARSLNFDVLNLCCSRGIPSLSWFLALKIAFKTMIPHQGVCTGEVCNCRKCKMQCGWPLSTDDQYMVSRLGLIINSALTACCQDLQVHHHIPLVTRHTKLFSRRLSGTFTNFEYRTAWSNVQLSATMPNFTATGPTIGDHDCGQ